MTSDKGLSSFTSRPGHPRRRLEIAWPVLVLVGLFASALCAAVSCADGRADDLNASVRLSPSDYLLKSREEYRDPVFDKYRVIDLSAKLGIGSDCGRMDFKSTLQGSLQNILDAKYFGNLGSSIIGAPPMLLTCYFSPTWCAILKHSQINANYLSQLRLDQCSLIDKYTDSRTDDFYRERQTCVRQSIEKNGGNLERALESCRGNTVWSQDLASWAGPKNGEKSGSNRLIDSSAQWAGMNDPESKSALNLVKAMVGDTVVSQGAIRVEYGERQSALTPRTYLQSIERTTHNKLCDRIIKRIDDSEGAVSMDRLVSDSELREVSPNTEQALVDRQTLRAISAMPARQRAIACKKLSDAVSMSVFTTDVNRSLDVLTTLSQNPHLPPSRKAEIEDKRRALKEQIELTLALSRERNEPLNSVLSQINAEGGRYQSEAVESELSGEASAQATDRRRADFLNCTDGVMCGDGP